MKKNIYIYIYILIAISALYGFRIFGLYYFAKLVISLILTKLIFIIVSTKIHFINFQIKINKKLISFDQSFKEKNIRTKISFAFIVLIVLNCCFVSISNVVSNQSLLFKLVSSCMEVLGATSIYMVLYIYARRFKYLMRANN